MEKFVPVGYACHLDRANNAVVIENFHGDVIVAKFLPVTVGPDENPMDEPDNLKVWQEMYQLAGMARLGEQTYQHDLDHQNP